MENTINNKSLFSKFETAKIVGMDKIVGGEYTGVPSGRGPGYTPSGERVMVTETLYVRDDGAFYEHYSTNSGYEWDGPFHKY